MGEQTDFEFREKLHEGRSTLVHRAIRASDGIPVVLKVLQGANSFPETLARFRREFEITHSLNSGGREMDVHGVIRALGYQTFLDRPMIVLEDFGGDSLDRFKGKHWNLDDFLNLALTGCFAR